MNQILIPAVRFCLLLLASFVRDAGAMTGLLLGYDNGKSTTLLSVTPPFCY